MQRKLETQLLVVPKTLKLNPGADQVLFEKKSYFEDLGFTFVFEENGDVKLLKVPRVGKQTLGEEDIHEMLFLLSDGDYQCKPQKEKSLK